MHLKVLTYNIHKGIGIDRRFRLIRIIKVLKHYNPDIALLQEVDKGVPRSKELDITCELAQALDYPYYASGENVKLRKGRYGNTTLSRYPIVYERNIDLTINSHKRRGCLYTKIQISGEKNQNISIDVFNLHLGLSLIERIQQIGVLIKSSEFKSLHQDCPCLIGGDFNDWRNLLSAIFLDILNFQLAAISKINSRRGICTYPSFSPQGALDKIYYRGETIHLLAAHRCRLLLSKIASDHLPIIVDFNLLLA